MTSPAAGPVHILGFDCYGHDAAAAIVRNGEMLGMVEEERFVRKKHVAQFPIHAIPGAGSLLPNELHSWILSPEHQSYRYLWRQKADQYRIPRHRSNIL